MKKAFFVALVAALTLTSCGDDDLRQWMDGVSNDSKGKIPSLPKVKIYAPVAYGVEDKLDPFSEAKIEPTGTDTVANANDPNRPDFDARELRNNILEKYPLETIQMIGYLNIDRQPIAVVQLDPTLVKQVKVGDWIGQDFGRVMSVTEQEVEIKEVIEDPNTKEWNERVNTLHLQVE
ncbi:MAG: pilus assembly protein PilP [Zoogloeaceae bacterium]|jgi:type IV pilus assembly protein PilP|nr:pilus assembly protein PilP [Zoogloeaceae bacterium]